MDALIPKYLLVVELFILLERVVTMACLALRRSGRRVTKEPAMIPIPISTPETIAIGWIL